MSKSKKHPSMTSARHKARTAYPAAGIKHEARHPLKQFKFPLIPVPVMVFILVWIWAFVCQGSVFRMVHENSFFAFNSTLMEFELSKPYGILWCIGRALLTTFRYPWIGALVLSFLLTSSCWLLGYAMRLTPKWRWVQYFPILVYTFIFTRQGVSNWYEAETGQVLGIPFCIFVILLVWGIIIRSFSRKHSPSIFTIPKDETRWQNLRQIAVAAVTIIAPMIYGAIARPYVRPLARMQVAVMEQDWQKVIDIAIENDEMSNRPMAANYAIALVQTDQIGERLFDIRLDYDPIQAIGVNEDTLGTSIYQMECNYHAGLVESAYHHAMNSLTMEGPTLRNLKMLCKTSLLRGEWQLAEKYLTILDEVPFEGDFVEKYRAMLQDTALIETDEEMRMVRLTEPIEDSFENQFMPPAFLGYNAALVGGERHSRNAIINSLMVQIYTKSMDGFMARIGSLQGTPPTSISEALALMSGKRPELTEIFPNLNYHIGRINELLIETQSYMTSSQERAAHALELFPKYKGFYPYYYFFGNLKATKKSSNKRSSSGVN